MKLLSWCGVSTIAALVLSAACNRTTSTVRSDAGSPPAIVAAAHAIDGCKWLDRESPGDAFVDPACPAMKSWEVSFGSKSSEHESELLDLLADPHRAARWVAARDLDHVRTPRWNKDEALTRRVLERLAIEADPSVAYRLGILVGTIDLADGKFSAQVLGALGPGSKPNVRAGVAEHVLVRNPKNGAVAAAVLDLARTGPPGARIAGLRALVFQSEGSPPCAVLLEASRDPDPLVSAEASTLTASKPMLKDCAANVDGVASALADRPVLTERHIGAIERLVEVASADQKKRLIAILRRVVQTKVPDSDARRAAFVVLRDRDPDVKRFAPAFLQDENLMLRNEAALVMGVEVPLGSPAAEAGSDATAPRGGDGKR